MNTKRVIPVIGIHNRSAVKTVKFKDPQYIGSPINSISVLCEQGADEVIVVDQAASRGAPIDWETLARMVVRTDVPAIFGGGITSCSDALRAVELGFDRVVVGSAGVANPGLLHDITDAIGAQAVIHALDVYDLNASELMIVTSGGNVRTATSLRLHMERLPDSWHGEFLLTSVNDDGTWSGLNINGFIQALNITGGPAIISGGASSQADVASGLAASPAISAVAIGNLSAYAGPRRGVAVGTFTFRKDLDAK